MTESGKTYNATWNVASRLSNASRLSRQLGVHRNTILSWRRGDSEPTLSMGLRLSEATGLPPTVLALHFVEKRASRGGR